MKEKPDVLVVIPARGGSKSIPRKNLRSLNGKPLISYAIETALEIKYNPDIYVSSEDEEILYIAAQFGAKVIVREKSLAADNTTLDPVVYEAFIRAQQLEGKVYDLIVTLQPTSPLLQSSSINDAIGRMIANPDIDTVISASDDTHLTWKIENGKYVPNFKKRVNRQYLQPIFRETGGFLITRPSVITPASRIGKKVDLYLLSGGEEIDIDTLEDWSLCEYYLKRKKILFVVSGNRQIGLGHVHNTLLVANDILDHQVSFLVDKTSQLAYQKIMEYNYPVFFQQYEDIVEDIKNINPDVVINDRLDTTSHYIRAIKETGKKVVNFEDLGEGARLADLVINAIYPEQEALPNHYFGPEFFILRDEFIFSPQKTVSEKVKNVLVTFGGVDAQNLTCKVVDAIYNYCIEKGIQINVVVGLGYEDLESLEHFPGLKVSRNVKTMASYMLEADIVFTSAGRTIYEVASIATPTIVMAQNAREMTHFFASPEYGFLNLGLGAHVSKQTIIENFKRLADSKQTRERMHALMKQYDLRSGRKRVNQLIRRVLEESS